MVFRLPTHLDSFVPPPAVQPRQARPWRGSITVSGARASDRSSQQIRVVGVETDGDNAMDVWPTMFYARVMNERPLLESVRAWVDQHAPPQCTFMPDRLRNPDEHQVNHSTFRSLSRNLFEHRTVAIAQWATQDTQGAGMIIFPSGNSSAMLVGVLFISQPFPSFISGSPPPQHQLYPVTQAPPHGYPSSRPHPGNPPLVPNPHSPLEPQSVATYRYTIPAQYAGQSASSSANPTWPEVKDEDDPNYATFHNAPYP